VDFDHVAIELEENKTDEAMKKEEVTFWEVESKEEEEWEEQEEECIILGTRESQNSNEET